MSIWKIALRSLQFRRLGSLLTVMSMALGVMMVVAVLTVYGVVNQAFRSNNSIGYDLLLGTKGGGLQLTLNSVYYLSRPVGTIPYDYYMAFLDKESRSREIENSIAWNAMELQHAEWKKMVDRELLPAAGGFACLAQTIAADMLKRKQLEQMQYGLKGEFKSNVEFAIPILLGDYYEAPLSDAEREAGKIGASFRVCATNRDFFDKLVLDLDTGQRFEFAEGRAFDNKEEDVGFFGCVIGSVVARTAGLKLGDRIAVTHGVPGEPSTHLHEDQLFEVKGILERSGTPHDRVVFVNMEGFFLFTDHIKPIGADSPLMKAQQELAERDSLDMSALKEQADQLLVTTRLPAENRELTSLFIAARADDDFKLTSMVLQPVLEEDTALPSTLGWTSFRPVSAQTSVQAVNPIAEINSLFVNFVDPIRWLLLGLTVMICIVSGLSILVGIYNSMSQRHHEIAVMRALGASRRRVMQVILAESVLLSVAGGMLGWLGGRLLNVLLSPVIESQTGVRLGFLDFAPAEPIFANLPAAGSLPAFFVQWAVSPELLLVPGLILLAIVVGLYPAISAYRADVSKSLGK